MKIAVFVSGGGTNLQVIIDAIEKDQLKNVTIEKVISDRACKALERAEKHQITICQTDRKDKEMFQKIDDLLFLKVDYIILAGFLSIIPEVFCQKWKNKIINLHPSLLPKYGGVGMYGDYVHQAVLKNKEVKSGATVHFVTGKVDQGEIIIQESFNIEENETLSSLKLKVQIIEHAIIIKAIDKLAKLTLR